MPVATIVPIASSLYLVDGAIGFPGGKTDLVGVFNTINAPSFPHLQNQFVVYARLVQGLGRIPFFVEIREAAPYQLIHVSTTNILTFAHRDKTVELAFTFQGIKFPHAGTFLIELYCDGQWVADTRLQLV